MSQHRRKDANRSVGSIAQSRERDEAVLVAALARSLVCRLARSPLPRPCVRRSAPAWLSQARRRSAIMEGRRHAPSHRSSSLCCAWWRCQTPCSCATTEDVEHNSETTGQRFERRRSAGPRRDSSVGRSRTSCGRSKRAGESSAAYMRARGEAAVPFRPLWRLRWRRSSSCLHCSFVRPHDSAVPLCPL